MIKKTYFLAVAILFCSVLILVPLNAQATALNNGTSVKFGLDFKYCGADEPEGLPAWLFATFENDATNPGTVNLKLYSSGLMGEEYVASWYFNLNQDLDAASLVISPESNSYLDPDLTDIYDNTIYEKGNTVFHAAKDKIFDMVFDFTQCAGPNASSVKRFTEGITLEYTIEGIDGLKAEDFFYVSDANGNEDKDKFFSAAHVLRIDMPAGKNSGWIAVSAAEPSGSNPVPEPCTMVLMGSGLISMAGFIRKFKK